MYLSTFDQIEQMTQASSAIDSASLYKELEKVEDGRKSKGKRYPLSLILILIMLGKMAGCTTIDAIVDWIDLRKEDLKKMLGWPKRFPSNKTYERTLSCCNGKEVAEIIAGVITKARAIEKCDDEPSRLLHNTCEDDRIAHTAVDGKTLRGTLKHAEEHMPPVHILTLYDCDTGITHTQNVYKRNESEISAADKLLHVNIFKNRIVSTDALYTYRRWCSNIHTCGGYYFTTVKENTPELYRDLEDYFGYKDILRDECEYFRKAQKGHGRLEVREIWTSTQMNHYFEKKWAGIAQIFMIRKTVIEKGERCIITRYGITSLPREKAGPERILELRQNHWKVENRSHYRRDVTLGEDACQIRVNNAPEVLAAINGGILALMDFLGVKNLAKQMRYYCAKPKEALKILLVKLSR